MHPAEVGVAGGHTFRCRAGKGAVYAYDAIGSYERSGYSVQVSAPTCSYQLLSPAHVVSWAFPAQQVLGSQGKRWVCGCGRVLAKT